MSQTPLPPLKRPPRQDQRPVLSTCTVLILSGFLLGIYVSSELTAELERVVYLAGLTGLVAYIGLDQVAHRRRATAELREQDYFQDRLVRHIDGRESETIDHEELLELARQVTSVRELRDLISTQNGTTVG